MRQRNCPKFGKLLLIGLAGLQWLIGNIVHDRFETVHGTLKADLLTKDAATRDEYFFDIHIFLFNHYLVGVYQIGEV